MYYQQQITTFFVKILKISIWLRSVSGIFFWVWFWYLLWFKSADNSVQNIEDIEKNYPVEDIPIVGFIFDSFDIAEKKIIVEMTSNLGKDRIFHITLSPKKHTAQEVADWVYDTEYKHLFSLIKTLDITVIFRTMHEMNGGRYPWGSDPESFKKARKHVYWLAQEAWLDNHNILFSFSVNHRDVPTFEDIPHKQSTLIFCEPDKKATLGCATFEDYYPWDAYVDLVGFSFYNRGRSVYNRARMQPRQILDDPRWRTLARLKSLWKPLFIDEVGTASVWYNWPFDATWTKAKKIYETDYKRKNERLYNLKLLLEEEESIVGAMYFNSDFTHWLQRYSWGETDWSVINTFTKKTYYAIYDLMRANEVLQNTALRKMFDSSYIKTKQDKIRIRTSQQDIIVALALRIKQTSPDKEEQKIAIQKVRDSLVNMTPSQAKIRTQRLDTIEKLLAH